MEPSSPSPPVKRHSLDVADRSYTFWTPSPTLLAASKSPEPKPEPEPGEDTVNEQHLHKNKRQKNLLEAPLDVAITFDVTGSSHSILEIIIHKESMQTAFEVIQQSLYDTAKTLFRDIPNIRLVF